MSGSELAVLAGAVAAIALVNWYFLVAGRTTVAATVAGAPGAVPEVVIEVDGGYSPNRVRVKAGQPVRLVFDRKDVNPCSDEVVIPDFGVKRFLPTGERTTIEITPSAPGSYGFACGMNMLRGTIVAEA